MFQRVIDDFKNSAGTTLQLTSLVATAALALLVTIAFLCAATFVFVLQRYGAIEACLTCAGIFFVISIIAAVWYALRKNKARKQANARAAEGTKSALHTALADPMLVATGIQLVRAVGIKRLIPIVAIGGLALGLLAGRNNPVADGDDDARQE
jgi:uncharacterized membrane protein